MGFKFTNNAKAKRVIPVSEWGNVEDAISIEIRPATLNSQNGYYGVWTVTAQVTVSCPPGMYGSNFTSRESYTSQYGFWDAWYGAVLAARAKAMMQLMCSSTAPNTGIYPNTTYTSTISTHVDCPSGTTGAGGDSTFTGISQTSQDDADAQAEAGAQQLATSYLDCASPDNSPSGGCLGMGCTGTPSGGGNFGGAPHGTGGNTPQPVDNGNGKNNGTDNGPATNDPVAPSQNCYPPVVSPITVSLVTDANGNPISLSLSATASSTAVVAGTPGTPASIKPGTQPSVSWYKLYNCNLNSKSIAGQEATQGLFVDLSTAVPYTGQTGSGLYSNPDGSYLWVGPNPSANTMYKLPVTVLTGFPVPFGVVGIPQVQWYGQQTNVPSATPEATKLTSTINILNAQQGDCYMAIATSPCGSSSPVNYQVPQTGIGLAVRIISPADGDTVSTSLDVVASVTQSGQLVTLNGVTAYLNGNPKVMELSDTLDWGCNYDISAYATGTLLTLKVEAQGTDASGNTVLRNQTISLHTGVLGPVITLNSIGTPATNRTVVLTAITGTNDTIDHVVFKANGTVLGNGTDIGNNTWTYLYTYPLNSPNDLITFSASAFDTHGISTASLDVEVLVLPVSVSLAGTQATNTVSLSVAMTGMLPDRVDIKKTVGSTTTTVATYNPPTSMGINWSGTISADSTFFVTATIAGNVYTSNSLPCTYSATLSSIGLWNTGVDSSGNALSVGAADPHWNYGEFYIPTVQAQSLLPPASSMSAPVDMILSNVPHLSFTLTSAQCAKTMVLKVWAISGSISDPCHTFVFKGGAWVDMGMPAGGAYNSGNYGPTTITLPPGSFDTNGSYICFASTVTIGVPYDCFGLRVEFISLS